MRYILFRTCLAVLFVLALAATGLWAGGESEGGDAAAADHGGEGLRHRPLHRHGGRGSALRRVTHLGQEKSR